MNIKSKKMKEQKSTVTKRQREQVIDSLEKLLARKVQIKAELAEIENTIKVFTLQMEQAPKKIKSSKFLKKSDDRFVEQFGRLEKREAELRGELLEINALTRSIPARRLKPLVNEDHVRRLILDAGLVGQRGKIHEGFRSGDCWTSCEVCVTSCNSECVACTECVTSCSTDCVTNCTSDCVQCPTECVTLCTYGCSSPCTVGGASGMLYSLPQDLDHADKTLPMDSLLSMVAKHSGHPDRVEIEWN